MKTIWRVLCIVLIAAAAIAGYSTRGSMVREVTLSENYVESDLGSVSGKNELAVTFASTEGPMQVQVTVYQEGGIVGRSVLGLQESLALSVDPRRRYDVKAALLPGADHGGGGRVDFLLASAYFH